jgi:NAD(P)-dependent dehydrogenase (short-subunit alcohol dehydrogenase family)
MFGDAVSKFHGERALFLHNAYYSTAVGYVGEGDAEDNLRSVLANIAGSLYLAEAFVRAAIESDHTGSTEFGLVLLSSGAASFPAEGMAAYCAGKAAIEQWVRVVRNERARRGTGPWVLAVRPGLVETPLLQRQSSYDKSDYPLVDRVNKWRSDDGSVWRASDAARAIWREVQAHDGKRDVIDIGSPSDTHVREIPAVSPIPAP